jgi:Phosphoribosylformylglycinamidine (FGAM) synthase, synthetase domain
MGQFVEVIKGMSEACLALDYPVISGNVSLYNETNGIGIKPTPTIGGVGLIQDSNKSTTISIKATGNLLLIIGETKGHIHQSALCYDILHIKKGPPPTINLAEEKKNSLFVRNLINKKIAQSVHDISDGGIALTIAEMCMSGKIGANIMTNLIDAERIKFLFGEDQARYVVEVRSADYDNVVKLAKEQEVSLLQIGSTKAENLTIDDMKITVEDMLILNNKWFHNYNSN